MWMRRFSSRAQIGGIIYPQSSASYNLQDVSAPVMSSHQRRESKVALTYQVRRIARHWHSREMMEPTLEDLSKIIRDSFKVFWGRTSKLD